MIENDSYDIEIARTRKTPREMSLVPMINVMLLLLIFFIVTGKIDPVDILPVNVPFSEQSGDTALGEAVISLGVHDEIIADEDVMFSMDDLRKWVADRIAASPKVRFTIKADANMEAVKLVDIMRFIETAGATDVVLAAQKP
jgi:biopolymer transport protein ExbD